VFVSSVILGTSRITTISAPLAMSGDHAPRNPAIASSRVIDASPPTECETTTMSYFAAAIMGATVAIHARHDNTDSLSGLTAVLSVHADLR